MNQFRADAGRIIRGLRKDPESHVEVCFGINSSLELDIRDFRFAAVQKVHDSFVAVRLQRKGRQYFVSQSGDASMADLRRCLRTADVTTRYIPFAGRQEKRPPKKTNPPDTQAVLDGCIKKLSQKRDEGKLDVNDLTIHSRTIHIKNTSGIEAELNESFAAIRYDLFDDGLDRDGKLCYPIQYCRPGEIPSNRTGAEHSGRFRSLKSRHDGLVLFQSNVMLELLAAWAQEQNSHESPQGGIFSDAVNLSESAPFCRFPSIDDTGRNIKMRWHVRRGRNRGNRFQPQGEYRKDLWTPPKAIWNTLILHPSKRPLPKLLDSISQGFYVCHILGLVFGKDFQDGNTLNLRLGGFDVGDGKIVGELRWIDRAFSFPTLFRSIIAVGDRLYRGRWKWADGWYACPSVLLKDLFV
jgi:predicted Zn-dependent protease